MAYVTRARQSASLLLYFHAQYLARSVESMFNIRGAFSNAVEAVQLGFTRLKEGIGKAVFRLVRPKTRSRCPPQVVDPLNDLRDRVLIIGSGHVAPNKELMAYPDVFPMATSPIQECSTQSLRKKGAQSARALFHNSFQPVYPVGVFEISSNAYSFPFQGSGTTIFSSDEFQSPLSSEGSDTQFTPLFTYPLNSPAEASTAPTTPDADILRLGDPTSIDGYSSSTIKALESEDDLPLSALMIRGMDRDGAKRNGISGALLSKRKDVPLWVPQVVLPQLGTSPSVPVETDMWVDDALDEDDDGNKPTEEPTLSFLSVEPPTAASSPPGPPYHRSELTSDPDEASLVSTADPFNIGCNAWLFNDPTPSIDEKSVYSLGSYISNPSTPTRRSPGRVPQITLTPPSVPTSPYQATYSPSLACGLEATRSNFEFENGFSGATLIVPSHDTMPRRDGFEGGVEDEDEAAAKRRRRNGCRLNTSSIDIIMAGLDQDFPDTPVASPLLGPLDLGEAFTGVQRAIEIPEAHESDDFPSPEASVYAPSSPATTVRNSVNIADLSGDTLLMGEDLELDSKFSDSSDEEDETQLTKQVTTMPVKYSRLSWSTPQTFSPCSVLSTIVEEEEDGNPTGHPIAIAKNKSGMHVLSSPAVIVNRKVANVAPFSPGPKVPKQRWFSMIENDKARRGPTPDGGFEKKHMSAPASMQGKSRVLSRAGGLSLGKHKSTVRPLILPQRLATTNALSVPSGEDYDNKPGPCKFLDDLESLSLPSSRSSNCISLYQGPPHWPLYVPAEVSKDLDSPSKDMAQSSQTPLPGRDTGPPASTPLPKPGTGAPRFMAPLLESGGGDPGADDSVGPIDLGQDVTFPLFMECPSSEYQGVGGIIAILDALDLPTTRYSQFVVNGSPRTRASPTWEGVSEFGLRIPAEEAGAGREQGEYGSEECDVATAQYQHSDWRDSDFVAYYEGPSFVSTDACEEGGQT